MTLPKDINSVIEPIKDVWAREESLAKENADVKATQKAEVRKTTIVEKDLAVSNNKLSDIEASQEADTKKMIKLEADLADARQMQANANSELAQVKAERDALKTKTDESRAQHGTACRALDKVLRAGKVVGKLNGHHGHLATLKAHDAMKEAIEDWEKHEAVEATGCYGGYKYNLSDVK